MRINKYLAECGIGSRRACDKIIEDGAVRVNGKAAVLGMEIDEKKDVVTVNDKKLLYSVNNEYYIMNKPKGCVCTVKDDKGRKTVMDFLPKSAGNVVPVGRLDYDTEGLLLFTNDGDLHFRLTTPKNEIPKTYAVKIEGNVTEPSLDKLRVGIESEGEKFHKCKVRIMEQDSKFTKLEVTITEGKNRQIRRMFEAIGKNVVFLKRTKIGDLSLRGLDRGKCRTLSQQEIEYLKFL